MVLDNGLKLSDNASLVQLLEGYFEKRVDLGSMRVEPFEIEFARDQEDHRAPSLDAGVSPRAAFGSLGEPVECFEETIGLSCLRPRNDAIEMIPDLFLRPFS